MRIPRVLTVVFGLIVLAALLVVGYFASRPIGPALTEADLSLTTITPNADGEDDVTEISYHLRRRADVSIYFEAEDGTRYYYRENEPRVRGDYSVLFSGVVDGFPVPEEDVKGEVLQRLLPDGTYRWVIESTDALTSRVDEITGPFVVANSDSILPDLWEFSISPEVFTPNQDGITDIVTINLYVPKEANLTVYLIDDEGVRYYIPETQETRMPGDAGRHTYRWDGGVDTGKNPPPDGTYKVLAEAEDAEGQRVRREGEVTVQYSGIPMAEIVGQPVGDTVEFSNETVIQGDTLSFQLTVENYSDAPIRTSGPAPGYTYEQNETYAASGYQVESGVWRVGIHCDTCEVDYPWRWGLGDESTLTPIEVNGTTYYYLMPGERAVVTGSIRLTDINETRNPQQFWAGLIHEDVEISSVNQHVDPHWITIEPADGEAQSTGG